MDYDIVKKLGAFNKAFFTVNDLEKLFGLKRASLKMKLTRLVRRKVLLRLRKGLYILASKPVEADKVASQVFQPSYVSFEYALARYGILGQIPYTVTLASPRLSLNTKIAGMAVEVRRLKKDLFFGYTLKDGVLIAEPEKALMDMLYMVSIGKSSFDLSELGLNKVNRAKAFALAMKYPKPARELLKKLFR